MENFSSIFHSSNSSLLNDVVGGGSNGLLGLKMTSSNIIDHMESSSAPISSSDNISNVSQSNGGGFGGGGGGGGGTEAEVKSGKKKVVVDKKVRKPRYAFQTRSQVDILDDGYRWRKYGQKAVKNNKFPRGFEFEPLKFADGSTHRQAYNPRRSSLGNGIGGFLINPRSVLLGIVGSVLAKEGRASNVSDFFSGALKIAFRQLRNEGSATPNAKPKSNATLLQQVNSLREELQLLATNRPVTIITSTSSGSGRYSVIIVIVVIGYGYIWWKGWKFSDMMFATRRSLSDACGNVSKRLENATKRHLSSRIDIVDSKVDECAENTAATKDEVSKLEGDVSKMGTDVQSVHRAVRSLGETIGNLGRLINFARSFQNRESIDQIEGAPSSSSRPFLELPQATPSRGGSLPSNLSVEPPSPSSSTGSIKLHAVSNGFEASGQNSPQVRNGIFASEVTSNGSSGSGLFGIKSSGKGPSLVRRTFSASMSFKTVDKKTAQ
ncbi:hypothetical protein M9H77_10344 [Catharanthus roseus]|uniref:Uncharacterized protein n=1 Tax=Catharanthus roseus TaxID=4058 RepID=A0ACC0C3I2_CATRO|nr:hypothetical protein M9H77_10344 [Catharanthus roseus]